MFLHKGKEYYPLEINQIYGKGNVELYNKEKRNKSYAYIAVFSEEKENEL